MSIKCPLHFWASFIDEEFGSYVFLVGKSLHHSISNAELQDFLQRGEYIYRSAVKPVKETGTILERKRYNLKERGSFSVRHYYKIGKLSCTCVYIYIHAHGPVAEENKRGFGNWEQVLTNLI